MDPAVLAAVVLVGVAAVVALTVLLGWSTPAELTADQAAELYLEDHPELSREGLEVVVAGDRSAALVWPGPGAPVGAVFVLGDRAVTRRLSPELIRRIEPTAGGLVIRLRDYTRPVLRVPLGDAATRELWRTRLVARP